MIVTLVTVPDPELAGTIACRLRAPLATLRLKFRALPFHVIDPKDELFRPSSHVSICRDDTTGMPCACAEATI